MNLARWEASEPARLEAAAARWVRLSKAQPVGAVKFKLAVWACHARAAAATLRALRAARTER